jgi:hypothetical protein
LVRNGAQAKTGDSKEPPFFIGRIFEGFRPRRPLTIVGNADWADWKEQVETFYRIRPTWGRQRAPASTLDSSLPRIPFEEWVRRQIGGDASVAWVLRSGAGDDFPYVEADVSVGNQPGIVIMIACGNRNEESKARPTFKSLELVRQGEFAKWRHLRDLPVAMRKTRGKS